MYATHCPMVNIHVPNMVSQCQTIKKFWAGQESAQTDGQTDGQTDRQKDRQSDSYIPPWTSFTGGIINNLCSRRLGKWKYTFYLDLFEGVPLTDFENLERVWRKTCSLKHGIGKLHVGYNSIIVLKTSSNHCTIPFTFGGGSSLCRIFSLSCWKDSARNGGCPAKNITIYTDGSTDWSTFQVL